VDFEARFAELKLAIVDALPGRTQRRARCALANAFVLAGRPEEALVEYLAAIEDADATNEHDDLAAMLHDAAHAACDAGRFDLAKALYQRSFACEEAATAAHLGRIASELEMARMDILRDLWPEAEEIVKRNVGELRALWRKRMEIIDAEAAHHEELKRVFLGALDIARQRAIVLRGCLSGIEAIFAPHP
jgi:tetratricopeptide (TPR) repeat protein